MITGINHITLAIKDLNKSFAFYANVLGFKPLVRWDKGAYFLAGDFWFCLNVDANRRPTPCYTHYAFTVTQEQFDEMSKAIIQSGIKIFKENTSLDDSLYFLDPDGHKLEIHVGNWQSRLIAKKINPGTWQNVEWFV
ncbi:fosfomycin resistance glutathione transferase [Legionella pneumophila]|uniref:fosfomycin resistance glutathione transferase n=1 Tax=Legionella pneumophila TaxID=446 RepID=UPI001374CCAA|nr:fosfomycin resistance glutathione transferase [Legionella pneumophila]HAT8814545.1 glutathione transferase [Legionella pneumophila subsp. pneumophila]MCZ4804732.1 fosfomycin resistance glutathione transferase [Legionella pneumophila]MDW9178262.1 fosfomycin resistance glutathione transferase [Legionella pneumophila]HAT1822763.1 glutathione transferase [Legionella pneumophila]HAT1863329.1 glutathione transferase [Legionella pneumophila]